MLSWPLAVAVGRRMKHYQGGVPVIPGNHMRFTHDFVNIEPALASRQFFRWYAFGTALLAGYLFAQYTVDPAMKATNGMYNRPDFKPKAAMVQSVEDNDVSMTSMKQQTYQKHKNLGDAKKGVFYRYFFTQDANFELKENPYRNNHPDDVYDAKKQYVTTYASAGFRDHVRD